MPFMELLTLPLTWLPPLNRCWLVRTIIRIKRRYGLTVDRQERRALASVLRQCE